MHMQKLLVQLNNSNAVEEPCNKCVNNPSQAVQSCSESVPSRPKAIQKPSDTVKAMQSCPNLANVV